ncbi:MAG: T9SS type A sorting domain-containing protein [Ignavibacteriota bacterium]
MKTIVFHIVLILSILLLLRTAADAQFVWQVAHTDFDGRFDYCFEVLSCNGETCTIAGSLVDEQEHTITRVFWRSTDNGISWKLQNPDLPVDTNFDHLNFFTKIQQIDPLHAVAIGVRWDVDTVRNGAFGDSALILMTSDAGTSWIEQSLPFSGIARYVQFSDSMTGILCIQENEGPSIGGGRKNIFTTRNGGKNWALKSFTGNIVECRSDGGDAFRIFTTPNGRIYSTKDNWNTIDSTNLILDPASFPDSKDYYLIHCNFSGGDTILAYGLIVNQEREAVIIRSTNRGISWESPIQFHQSLPYIDFMTSLDRDTVLAAGTNLNNILMSTDRGTTWRVDSLIIDTAYSVIAPRGLEFTMSGIPLAIYSYSDIGYSIPSILLRGLKSKSGVENTSKLSYRHRIFPNPASNTLYIASVENPKPYWIVDMLGRTKLSGETRDHSVLNVDISSLPTGVYEVLSVGVYGKMSIGKLMVAGK